MLLPVVAAVHARDLPHSRYAISVLCVISCSEGDQEYSKKTLIDHSEQWLDVSCILVTCGVSPLPQAQVCAAAQQRHADGLACSLSVVSKNPYCKRRFAPRHNSGTPTEVAEMVAVTGFDSLDALVDATVPKAIRRPDLMDLGAYTEGMRESEFLTKFKCAPAGPRCLHMRCGLAWGY